MAQQQTLFQILLRQPWWVTLLVSFGMFGIGHAVFPPVAPFVALPFVVLTGYIAFNQFRSGAPVNAAERLAALRAMPWESFSATVVDAYKRQGYEVTPSAAAGYDFRLAKDGRVLLVQCRRWKVNQVGAAPVRELADAVAKNDAYKGVCLAAGEFSAPARKLAVSEPVTLVSGADLVELLKPGPKRKLWRFVR